MVPLPRPACQQASIDAAMAHLLDAFAHVLKGLGHPADGRDVLLELVVCFGHLPGDQLFHVGAKTVMRQLQVGGGLAAVAFDQGASLAGDVARELGVRTAYVRVDDLPALFAAVSDGRADLATVSPNAGGDWAASVSLDVGADRVARLAIANANVGHAFPSGGNWVSVRLQAVDGGNLVRQLRELGYRGTIVVGNGMNTPNSRKPNSTSLPLNFHIDST